MRIRSFLTAVALFASVVSAVEIFSSPSDDDSPDLPVELLVTASFPESNTFGHVINGEQNKLLLTIENRLGKNVTLLTVAGEFLDPTTGQLIKRCANNLTYGIYLPDTARIQLPYNFYSEFKTGDIKLSLWLEHVAGGERQKVSAFDSIVTVVEPELSFFDFKLLSTYAIVFAILGGLGYVTYCSFAPQPKQKKRAPPPPDSVPTASTVTATGSGGGYQEEWIPEHHLRKAKARKAGSAVSSGDEKSAPSGGEASASGTEGKRRSSRLRK
ncbi:hypothetical protein BGW80DRAFT_1342852 [Lactifluus volemus]|nr:hypothetical protein BGW80DRAFT_1342852 [Lactifluus volemus]